MLEELKTNLMMKTAEGGLSTLITFGARVLIAILIFLIGRKLIRILKQMFNRSFQRMDMEISLRKFLIALIQAAAYGVMILIIAEELGFQSASVLAVLGSAGLALSLSLQNSLSNFAGGVMILVMKPFKVGDYIITSNGEEGTVAVIGLVYTTLMSADNKQIVIPNGNLSNSPLTNVTGQEKRRVDVSVGIGYNSDLRQAKDILKKILETREAVLKDEPIVVFVDQLGDSAVVIGGRCWTGTEDYWTTKWEIQEQIKLEYDRAGIEIPFQQMDIHVKTN
ncbi:MAG: mechanosensitive ion channel family protein [Lachnospiraceae bacterium]